MNIVRIGPDFATVTNMWADYAGQPKASVLLGIDTTKLLLAVTAPENQQLYAWKLLKGCGFKKIATGLRTPGHTGGKYLYLWGKLNDGLPKLKMSNYGAFSFASCGAIGHAYRKAEEIKELTSWQKVLSVHRVLTRSKVKIPKDFELIAETKFARYYVENFEEILETLL